MRQSLSSFLVLAAAVLCFALVARDGNPAFVASDWYNRQERTAIQGTLISQSMDRLTRPAAQERLDEDLICRDRWASALPAGTSIDRSTIGEYLYAVYTIETYNRPAVTRWFETRLAQLILSLGFTPPDWSLGVLQIKPSTAVPYLVGDAPPSRDEATRQLLDPCLHTQIGLSLIQDILLECEDTARDPVQCFAEEYNGNRANPLGPTYLGSLSFLLNRMPMLDVGIALPEPDEAPRPIPPPVEPISPIVVVPGPVGEPEASLGLPPEVQATAARLFSRIIDGGSVACTTDLAVFLSSGPACSVPDAGPGSTPRERLSGVQSAGQVDNGECLARVLTSACAAGRDHPVISEVLALAERSNPDAPKRAVYLGALARDLQARIDPAATEADRVRQMRRFSERLTDSAVAGLAACDAGVFTAAGFCAESRELMRQAALSWKDLLAFVETGGLLETDTPAFGPASYSVENLSWRVVQRAGLREFFSPTELDRLLALLTVGVDRFGSGNPRYHLTHTALECVLTSPDLMAGEMLTIPLEGSAAERDRAVRCMQALIRGLADTR